MPTNTVSRHSGPSESERARAFQFRCLELIGRGVPLPARPSDKSNTQTTDLALGVRRPPPAAPACCPPVCLLPARLPRPSASLRPTWPPPCLLARCPYVSNEATAGHCLLIDLYLCVCILYIPLRFTCVWRTCKSDHLAEE